MLVWENFNSLPRLRSQTEASMSRPSQTESTYVQTVPDGSCLCPDFRAFARLSCVHVQTFVRSPDFHAFMSRLSCVHQTFVRSCPDFRAFTRLSCVQPIFVRSCPDFRAFDRFLCVHVQTFVRSTDFRAFMSRLLYILLDILASVWDLNLGCLKWNLSESWKLSKMSFLRNFELILGPKFWSFDYWIGKKEAKRFLKCSIREKLYDVYKNDFGYIFFHVSSNANTNEKSVNFV